MAELQRVLVTQRIIENSSYHEIREALDVQWAPFLAQAGLLPIPVASGICVDTYFNQLHPEGVLLTGGNDLSVVTPSPINERRDAFEAGLIDCAIKHRIPVLGVCRGFQLLIQHFGGKLRRIDDHVAVRHALQFRPSATSERFSALRALSDANSYHCYAAETVPEDFEVAIESTDGAAEAIGHRFHPIAALMWHPERETPFRSAEIEFVRRFFKER